jgi:hypothetical protein
MKIDRVLLSVNNNKTYSCFWNLVSYVWKTKFNVTPTLIFHGTEDEFKSNQFDFTYGDYILLEKFNDISNNTKDWATTWSPFYAATLFDDEICMTSGIDQIPISNLFFERIKNINNDMFVIGFSECYENYKPNTLGYFNTKTNVMYPSSHLAGSGQKFKDIFGISDNWRDEIYKVYNSKEKYYLSENNWGLDECYFSEKISIYNNQNKIVYLKELTDFWFKNRIDVDGDINENYTLDNVKLGLYSELTTKNYFSYENTIKDVINNINNFNI